VRFETLAYWDGILSGLFVDQAGRLWYLTARDETLGGDQERIYDAWELFEQPTDAQLEDASWRPDGEHRMIFSESFVRSIARYESE